MGALVSFDAADPVGASPVGALASFDGVRPRCRRTALRLILRVLPIRRSDTPSECKVVMARTLSIASRWCQVRLFSLVVPEKPVMGAAHAFPVQLVSFQVPITRTLSACADI